MVAQVLWKRLHPLYHSQSILIHDQHKHPTKLQQARSPRLVSWEVKSTSVPLFSHCQNASGIRVRWLQVVHHNGSLPQSLSGSLTCWTSVPVLIGQYRNCQESQQHPMLSNSDSPPPLLLTFRVKVLWEHVSLVHCVRI